MNHRFGTRAIHAGARPALANLLGGTVAITLVFFTSTRYVFRGNHSFLAAKFSAYVLYQLLSMSCYSLAIEALVGSMSVWPIVAKAIVTPASFCTNYLFMKFLVARRVTAASVAA